MPGDAAEGSTEPGVSSSAGAVRTEGVPRFVVDESRFALQDCSPQMISDALHRFNELLRAIRLSGHRVARSPLWDAVICRDGRELWDVLSTPGDSGFDRDVLRRTAIAMDKCPEWETPPGAQLDDPVGIGGSEPAIAMSVAFAHWQVRAGHQVACLSVAKHAPDDGCPACRHGLVEIFHPRYAGLRGSGLSTPGC